MTPRRIFLMALALVAFGADSYLLMSGPDLMALPTGMHYLMATALSLMGAWAVLEALTPREERER